MANTSEPNGLMGTRRICEKGRLGDVTVVVARQGLSCPWKFIMVLSMINKMNYLQNKRSALLTS